jgi:hypothetical protein
VDGIDDLAAIDALEVGVRDTEVGVPELPPDHDERNALVRHLDGVSVPQLVRREAATFAREAAVHRTWTSELAATLAWTEGALVAQRSEKMRWSMCTCIRRAACPDGRWALVPS